MDVRTRRLMERLTEAKHGYGSDPLPPSAPLDDPWPEGLHQAMTNLERNRMADPLNSVITKLKATDMSQARYVLGLAQAIRKGNSKVAKEFFSKLSKATLDQYIPMDIRKLYGQ